MAFSRKDGWIGVVALVCLATACNRGANTTGEGTTGEGSTSTGDHGTSAASDLPDESSEEGDSTETGGEECTPAPSGAPQRVVWERSFDFGGKDRVGDVVESTLGQPTVAGIRQNEAFVAMHDTDGDEIWDFTWDAADRVVHTISATPDGGVVVGGQREPGTAGWLAKFDADGTLEWDISPVTSGDWIAEFAVAADGQITVFGVSAFDLWLLPVSAGGDAGAKLWGTSGQEFVGGWVKTWPDGGVILSRHNRKSFETQILHVAADGAESWMLMLEHGGGAPVLTVTPQGGFAWVSDSTGPNLDWSEGLSALGYATPGEKPEWEVWQDWCGGELTSALSSGPQETLVMLKGTFPDKYAFEDRSQWTYHVLGYTGEGEPSWVEPLPTEGDHMLASGTDASDGIMYVAGATGEQAEWDYYIAKIDTSPP